MSIMESGPTVQFTGIDELEQIASSTNGRRGGPGTKEPSNYSLVSAPAAPPHEHHRASLAMPVDGYDMHYSDIHDEHPGSRMHLTFGVVSKRMAYREIRQARKQSILMNRPCVPAQEGVDADEGSPLVPNEPEFNDATSPSGMEVLKEMILANKVNLLLALLPLAWWSQKAGWRDSSVFLINFFAMVPLASMMGEFTEELATHTNELIGGLINATFGNAVEMVVAIQALLASDYRVVQASLIGSIFSNLLLVLGMCFLFGGIKHSEQEFIGQGAVASIALLGFFGLMLMMPEFFGDGSEDEGEDVELKISRIGAALLVLMYCQLLFFQLKTHMHLFQGDSDEVSLFPFPWALAGLVVITGMVTILSEWLVGSIDGFCEEFNLGKSFVGVILLPLVGNAVEHISAVSVAMKNKMDLALGIALGSSVQIALFVMPMVVVIGMFTGQNMSMKFPRFEVYLFLLSVVIVSMCLTNQRSNWLEGSLLVFTYVIVAVGIYFEEEDIDHGL